MDEEALMRASEQVVGKHDFTSFAASDPTATRGLRKGWKKKKTGRT